MKAFFKKIGNWPAFARLAANLTKELHNARIMSLRRWGLRAEAIAKGHISRQDLNWVPLSSSHVQYKSSKGYSTNILVMTSTYFQNITTWTDVVKGEVYVGVKSGVTYKSSDPNVPVKSLEEIVRVHEYGFGNIPARPLWKPTSDEVMAWHVKSKNRPGDLFLEIIAKKYS